MARRTGPASAEVVALLRAQAQRWPELPNVTSVGVGYRLRAGRRLPSLTIQVTVRRKLSPADLRRFGIDALPARVSEGRLTIGVDVVQRAYRPSFVLVPETPASLPPPPADMRLHRRRRLARIRPGASVGHATASAGTIGAIVYDRTTGRPCVLSNAHVLAALADPADGRVVQPGRTDDGNLAGNALGDLLRSHVGLAGDCAVASITGRVFDDRILELDVVPRRMAKVEIDDVVVKSGRTTGVTRGRVVRVGVVVRHDYGGAIGVQHVGGFEIGPLPGTGGRLCDEGDSGSLWLVEDPAAGAGAGIAAGLHFAQQDDPASPIDHALACNVHSVLDKLDVSLAPPP